MAITQLTKIVDGSITPSNEQLSGTLVELSQDSKNVLKSAVDGLMVDLTGYATETLVDTKIAEAQLSGGEVDLSAYATKEELNTAVSDKPTMDHVNGLIVDLSTNVGTAIEAKVDKVAGKGLSTEDFTTAHKTSIEGIDTTIDSKVSEAIATVVGGAPATFDTLKEISDWIQGDGVSAAELTTAVAGKADTATVNASLATKANTSDLATKMDVPSTLDTPINTTTVNSLPLYTLNNSGAYVLCTPDKWLLINGMYIPAYNPSTIEEA